MSPQTLPAEEQRDTLLEHLERLQRQALVRGDRPMTVEQLENDLRRMLGHVGKRERRTVLNAIEAIHELALKVAMVESRLNGRVNVITKIEEPPGA